MKIVHCNLHRIKFLKQSRRLQIFHSSTKYGRISTVTSYCAKTLNRVWSSSSLLYIIQTWTLRPYFSAHMHKTLLDLQNISFQVGCYLLIVHYLQIRSRSYITNPACTSHSPDKLMVAVATHAALRSDKKWKALLTLTVDLNIKTAITSSYSGLNPRCKFVIHFHDPYGAPGICLYITMRRSDSKSSKSNANPMKHLSASLFQVP